MASRRTRRRTSRPTDLRWVAATEREACRAERVTRREGDPLVLHTSRHRPCRQRTAAPRDSTTRRTRDPLQRRPAPAPSLDLSTFHVKHREGSGTFAMAPTGGAPHSHAIKTRASHSAPNAGTSPPISKPLGGPLAAQRIARDTKCDAPNASVKHHPRPREMPTRDPDSRPITTKEGARPPRDGASSQRGPRTPRGQIHPVKRLLATGPAGDTRSLFIHAAATSRRLPTSIAQRAFHVKHPLSAPW